MTNKEIVEILQIVCNRPMFLDQMTDKQIENLYPGFDVSRYRGYQEAKKESQSDQYALYLDRVTRGILND